MNSNGDVRHFDSKEDAEKAGYDLPVDSSIMDLDQEDRIKHYQKNKKPENPPMKNPLRLGGIRNKKCVCGSGIKIKKCCGIPVWVEWKIGQLFLAAIRGDQFTFDYIKRDILKGREESEATKNDNA